jgi:hypothetical protein
MKVRFSIGLLLALIAISGVGLAALRTPSHAWASTLFAVSLGSLPLALLNAMYSRERRRAFWTGFLVCGAAYFTATQGPWFRDEFGPRMVTTAIIDMAYSRIAPADPSAANRLLLARSETVAGGRSGQSFPTYLGLPVSSDWTTWWEPDRKSGANLRLGNFALVSPETFRRIGHSLFTLVLAALGGLYARGRYDAGTP